MKVFFIPYYYYLHYGAFVRIMKELNIHENVLSYLVDIQPRAVNETANYHPDRFDQDGIAYLRLQLIGSDNKDSKVRKLILYLRNRKIISDFLSAEKPDVIVLGSDLGGLYIRVIQDFCLKRGIQVYVVNTAPSGPHSQAYVHPLKQVMSRRFGWARTLYFDDYRIGSYSLESTIAVPGVFVKQTLIAQGINSSRVIITGNPAYDELFNLNQDPDPIYEKQPDEKVILYCTDCIQELYGNDYVKRINERIMDAVLSLDSKVCLWIKFHPREPAETKKMYDEQFAKLSHRIVSGDAKLLDLLRQADVTITHMTSSVIAIGVALRKPVLGINLHQIDSPYWLDRKMMVISESELGMKLKSVLYEWDKAVLIQIFHTQMEYNLFMADGLSSKRVADLIMSRQGKFEQEREVRLY